ncbi:MAG: nucleotidyltransferase domain-containing protein [Chloroflexota bacterium]
MGKRRGASREVSTLVRQAVEAILNRLAEKPRLIVLFGSEARGDATPESDVDILVVADRADRDVRQQVLDATYQVMWNRDFDRLISVVVMPTSEFEEQKRKGFSFVRNVEREGIVLWPAA